MRRPSAIAVGRSLLALGQLVTLSAASGPVLFARTPQAPDIHCSGLRSASLWCQLGTGPSALLTGQVIAGAVLAAVLAGYRPRWTCVPHCYVAFSLHASLAFPNGGEYAAQIATLLLVPICLGDRRTWQWEAPGPVLPGWRGAAQAAHLAIRCQLLIVYFWAATAKLEHPSWRHGTALRAIADDPLYGAAPWLRQLLRVPLASGPFVAALGWAVMATELAIAGSMLGRVRVRRYGLAAAVALHLGIAVSMGLPSFSVVMIGFVVLGSAGAEAPGDAGPEPPHEPEPPEASEHAARLTLTGPG
jgi:antimicrobial peptide system SdpB family protein